MKTSYRTCMCTQISKEDLGKEVTLCGWVQAVRDLGGVIFIHLRDRSGVVQIVSNQEDNKDIFSVVETLRHEDVVQISGEVIKRDEENYNENIETGDVEVRVDKINVLDKSDTPPIYVDDTDNTNEATRLEYRFLDLRKPFLQKNMMVRAKTAAVVRNFLNENGFLEIETPFLGKPTPEGARDFLVPSRVRRIFLF